MKRILIVAVLAAMAACSGNKEAQEETITGYLRETVSGIKPEYAVKLSDVTETGTVTVADSIAIVTAEFEEKRSRELSYAETLLSTLEMAVAMQSRSSYTSAADKEEARQAVIRQQTVIDSLRTMTPAASYDGRSSGEVLAKVVRAKVSVEEPQSGRMMAEAYDFYLSPDGKTCYGKSVVK